MDHFQIFEKINNFPKNILSVCSIKKTNCIFEKLSNLYLIVLLISFFPLLLWNTAENWIKLKKCLFELQNQTELSTTNIQTAPDYSSATAIMLVILWTDEIHSLHLKNSLTLSWRRPLSYRNQPIDLLASQWAGFYMITASVMKELSKNVTRLLVCVPFLLRSICKYWNFIVDMKIFTTLWNI